MSDESRQVTELLQAMRTGDQDAGEQLYRELHSELRRIARSKMGRAPKGVTLQTTALVHEAYLQLAGRDPQWENRRHFFFTAARAMQDILVQQARRRAADKRGGAARHVTANDLELAVEAPAEDMLALEEALLQLEKRDPTKAQLVRLRFFAGLGEKEVASVLDVSQRTVQREWRVARALLFQLLSEDGEPPELAP